MLERAGYQPAKHLVHISKIQKKEGADSIKLGAVSGQQYKEIFKARAFDKYFFQVPPKKRYMCITAEEKYSQNFHKAGDVHICKHGARLSTTPLDQL